MYVWILLYMHLFLSTGTMMSNAHFSCSQAIVLLVSLQLWQLRQPINNAVCASNIDDPAPRTVDIHAVATIAASPHLQILHPLLRITVASTCCGYTAVTTVVFCPLLWIFCIHLLWIHCCHCCGILSTTVDLGWTSTAMDLGSYHHLPLIAQ